MTVTAVQVAVKRRPLPPRHRPQMGDMATDVGACEMNLYCSGGEEYLCTRWRRAWRGKGGGVQSRLFAIIGIFTVYEMADLYNIIITHIYTETRPVRPDIVVIIIISYVIQLAPSPA